MLPFCVLFCSRNLHSKQFTTEHDNFAKLSRGFISPKLQQLSSTPLSLHLDYHISSVVRNNYSPFSLDVILPMFQQLQGSISWSLMFLRIGKYSVYLTLINEIGEGMLNSICFKYSVLLQSENVSWIKTSRQGGNFCS